MSSRIHHSHLPSTRSLANLSVFFLIFTHHAQLLERPHDSRADHLQPALHAAKFISVCVTSAPTPIPKIDFNSIPSIFKLHFPKRSPSKLEEVNESASEPVPLFAAACPGSRAFIRLQQIGRSTCYFHNS